MERALIGSKSCARFVKHFGGHPDRGQRGAQFVRDIGDEPLLHLGQRGQLRDLLLQAAGHVVEGGSQPGQLVLAPDFQPLLQLARGQASPTRSPPG